MYLSKIQLLNFKNHQDSVIDLVDGINGFFGKNGSGKSTFLKLISGILKPNSGNINCQVNVGMVFQNPDHQILFFVF